MKKNIFLCISIFSFLISYGQNSLKAIIRDSSNYKILAGAQAITDSAGKGNIANKKALFKSIIYLPVINRCILKIFTK